MSKATTIAMLTLVVGLAACGENAIAPTTQATNETTNQTTLGSNASLSGWDTIRFNIVIDPARKTSYNLGQGNYITFPAGSLCDPNKSTYGVGEWDKPCTLATQPLTINAKAWLDRSGHPRIDFNPSVRFLPSVNPLNWVMLTFTDYSASWLGSSGIGYCRTVEQVSCMDESTQDLTMVTVRDPVTGKLTRRIKHFSGYNVFSGRDDDSGSGSSFDVGVAKPDIR